jgi:translation initiation factor IF-2
MQQRMLTASCTTSLQLNTHNVTSIQYYAVLHNASQSNGGTIPVVPVSAKTGSGLSALVEAVLLQAEVMELHADAAAPGEAVVIDSCTCKGLGVVADVLVSWGRLKKGDYCVVGTQFGRIKRLQVRTTMLLYTIIVHMQFCIYCGSAYTVVDLREVAAEAVYV